MTQERMRHCRKVSTIKFIIRYEAAQDKIHTNRSIRLRKLTFIESMGMLVEGLAGDSIEAATTTCSEWSNRFSVPLKPVKHDRRTTN